MFRRLYLRCKVAVSTMILLDRVKDSAVNNTRSGRYKGLKRRETHDKEESNGTCHCTCSCPQPVIDGTGSKVGVENSDDNRCCVSKNGIIDDVEEFNKLHKWKPRTNKLNHRSSWFFLAVPYPGVNLGQEESECALTCSCQLWFVCVM